MKRRYKEGLVVSLAAVVVMALSVGVTFMVTNAPSIPGDDRNIVQRAFNLDPPEEQVPSEIPMQSAYAACRSHIENEVGPNLQSASFDNRASRHNASERYYQIFVNVNFSDSSESVYSRCNVSSIDGEILEYRLRSDEGFMFNLF